MSDSVSPTGLPAATEPLAIVPFEQARASWDELAASHPAATLYHSASWAELLSRAYGFRILVAMVRQGGTIAAGCLLSPNKLPFTRRLIGLPFSDSAVPLGVGPEAIRTLLEGLADSNNGSLEIRGVAAPASWKVNDCFRQWSIDVTRPFPAIERDADRNFRRQARRAITQAVRVDVGDDEARLRRFYRMELETRRRLGVPPQPWRFFSLLHELFAKRHALELWIATRDGRDLAGVVVLRERGKLYAKWSARTSGDIGGASHLVFLSILEHYAGKADLLDLGRTDARNAGLIRFKREMGASASPLPYSYFPRIRRWASAEVPSPVASTLAKAWRLLPLPFTRAIGKTTYGYFA